MRAFWESQNGVQPGNPSKLARALLTIADEENPPRRFIAGADALAQAEEKFAERQQQIDAYRERGRRPLPHDRGPRPVQRGTGRHARLVRQLNHQRMPARRCLRPEP